jgi:micrococcal nuclease
MMKDTLYHYNCELIRVIDGDTLVAMVDLGFSVWSKVEVRLFGIDAPESRTKNLDEKKRGLASKERVISLLEQNSGKFILKSCGVDKYGRALGEIYLDSLGAVTVSQTLINEGLAIGYWGGTKNK